MPPTRPDRRIERTRRRLKAALIELLGERDYARITVAHLTRRADVGRSTFYVHFASKDALLFDGFEDGLRGLAARGPTTAARAGFRFSLPLLRHIGEQRRFARATLVDGAPARIRRRTTVIVANVVRHELERAVPARSPSERQALAAQAHGVAGAFLGLVSWWLTEGSALNPEELDQLFQRLIGGWRRS